tara:strand:+ start:312 stop:821 length:510 start_codon:yes stop_codon:yes gene_type:complete
MTKLQSKEDWIQEQHDKAVKVHHANIKRIELLEQKINDAISSITSQEPAIAALRHVVSSLSDRDFSKKEEKIFARCDHTFYWGPKNESNSFCFSENYLAGICTLQAKQRKLCIEVAKWQQEIDKHSWDDSVKIMNENINKEKLEEEYDKLVKARGNELLKSLRNDEEAA